MKSVSLVEAKTLKKKCPLHSRFAFLCKQWRRKCWKEVCAQYHSEMQMIPLRKGRQTYCVIFIVLMVTGAIKLIVRHKSALLFENGRAKSLFITGGQITIDDQAKQGIWYWEMAICSDFALPHSNKRADTGKHRLQRIMVQGPLRFSSGRSRINPGPSLKEPVQLHSPHDCCSALRISPHIYSAGDIKALGFETQPWGPGNSKLPQITQTRVIRNHAELTERAEHNDKRNPGPWRSFGAYEQDWSRFLPGKSSGWE